MKIFAQFTKTFMLGVFAVLVIFAGCGVTYNGERAYWHASRKYRPVMDDPARAAEKDFSEATAALRAIVTKYQAWDNAAQVQLFIARMLATRKDFDGAERELGQLIVHFPEKREICAQAGFMAGSMKELQGDWNGAVRKYNEVTALYPTTSLGLQIPLYIANRYRQRNVKEESDRIYAAVIRNYLNLIEMNPYGPQVPALQYLTIVAFAKQGKWNECVQVLERFAQKYPKSDAAPLALYRAALVYRDVFKKPESAITYYQKIIADYPKTKLGKNARFDLGNLSLIEGNVGQAQKEFGEALDEYPDDRAFCAAAQLAIATGYERSGKWDDAIREYDKLQTSYPDSLEAMQAPVLIARHYHKEGRFEEEKASLDKALSWYKSLVSQKKDARAQASIYEYIANVYALQNKWNEAIAVFQEIRQKYPQDPRSATSLLRIGIIYQEALRDSRKAKELYKKFIEEYPNHQMISVARDLMNK